MATPVRRLLWWWTLAGTGFGCAFPLVGLLVAGGDLASAHVRQPVLYIVDLAPLVLGVGGLVIGRRHAQMVAAASAAEALAADRHRRLDELHGQVDGIVAAKASFTRHLVAEMRRHVVGMDALVTEPFGKRELEALDDKIHRLNALLDDLDLAAGGGRVELRPARIELSRTVERAVTSIRDIVGEGVDLELDVTPSYADPTWLGRVMRHLALNAVQHGGDRLRIRTFMDSGSAVIEVCDDGPPITGAATSRMFDPYVRLARSGDNSLGIGLAVVRSLVEGMEGTVRYRHRAGWSVFEVRLPLEPSAGRSTVAPHEGAVDQCAEPSKPSWRQAS